MLYEHASPDFIKMLNSAAESNGTAAFRHLSDYKINPTLSKGGMLYTGLGIDTEDVEKLRQGKFSLNDISLWTRNRDVAKKMAYSPKDVTARVIINTYVSDYKVKLDLGEYFRVFGVDALKGLGLLPKTIKKWENTGLVVVQGNIPIRTTEVSFMGDQNNGNF